ncbi:hypothetical protein FHR81_002789 [Actinoalloteichus hoggarensis]|uniref:Uncharacterized protein n=1 Tax=Actinoalloteichus hoggarensis TaxID=1470176 RepID=A0A221VXZ7_9PSEU|nr:hypothetical protein [Actinoalloteichus hoggarensis]ASO18385.1 hypothetical protein AHOG_03640 [Actinoalloteichus hoggarensis]MBB5921749.1 hypothetical protein [Actinoalloteichus hoggarensis]
MADAEWEQAALPLPPDATADAVTVKPVSTPLATPLLLQGQEYHYRAPNACLDFQERMYRAGLVEPGDGSPEPCVLVLARAADMEMNELSLTLAEHDIRMVRIDADRCLDLALTVYPDTPLIELDQWLLRPLLVWRRHFDLTALPVDPRSLYGSYALDQWAAVADWLTVRPDWGHVNEPRSSARLDRLTQLADAQAEGFAVPRTVVTTRPARNRPGGARCIVKTAGRHLLEPRPGSLQGLFPRPLDTSRAGELSEPAPVIVQQYLAADAELRVFVVGRELIAYRVDKLDPAQLWQDPDAVAVTPVEAAPDVADRLRALAARWRLDVAAFDLLEVEGEHVFLEVNVSCDWRWFENRAGETSVSDAVNRWIVGRFDELRRAERLR